MLNTEQDADWENLFKEFVSSVFELCINPQLIVVEILFTLNYTYIELNYLKSQQRLSETQMIHAEKACDLLDKTIDSIIRIERLTSVSGKGDQKLPRKIQWTGKIIDLVEIIYALDTKKCIENGEISIMELSQYFGQFFGVDIKDCYSSYVDIRRRKKISRTYFLEELIFLLNARMENDDTAFENRYK